MIIYLTVLTLYSSFLVEFLVWPVPSEASSLHLMKKWNTNTAKQNIIYILIFIYNSVFTLVPLILSIYFLLINYGYEVTAITFPGIIFAWAGRFFSLTGAWILYHNAGHQLVTGSIFKWSRNPISLGLYTTFGGLVLIFPYPLLIPGWILFLLNLNYKVNLEENFLKEKYGMPYILYQKSTPKYLFV